MSYSSLGDGVVAGFKFLLILAAVSVPLAIWKLIDIAIWLYDHVSIQWSTP